MDSQAELILTNAKEIMKNVDLSAFEGKTVLITGASGLLGVHFLACLKLANETMKKPCYVVAVVNREPLAYVRQLLNYPAACFIQGDLTEIDFCRELPQADIVIHAASYGQPIRFMENPIKTLKLNTLATFILFEKLRPDGKFLFISTSEVYTGLTVPPFKEIQIGTTTPNHPRACYIEAKRCGEAIVNAYREKGIDAKSARLALAYGPGTRPDDKRVISTFIRQAFQGKITLLDHGSAKRAFCYVTDAVELFFKILIRGKEPLYNVGGVGERSIAELAQTIGEMMHVPVNFPQTDDILKGAPQQAWLDMDKASLEFGKTAFVPLEDGLEKTIAWYHTLFEAAPLNPTQ